MIARIAPGRFNRSAWFGVLLCAQFAICGFSRAAEPPPTVVIPLVLPWGHSLPVSCVAFSNDGKRIVTGSGDHTAVVWDAITGRELGTLGDLSQDAITSIAISADGRYVATGSALGEVVVWDTNTRKKRRTLVWHQDKVTSLAFHDNSNQIWSTSADKSAVVWNVASGLKRQVLNTVSPIVSAAINPDGTLAVTDETDGTVVLWNLASGKRIHTLPGKPAPKPVVPAQPDADAQPAVDVSPWEPVEGVAFSLDGKQFAAALPDKSIVICIGDTGETLHTLVGHDAPVVCLAFSSDGKQLVSASCTAPPDHDTRNLAWVWDSHTGKQIRSVDRFDCNPVGINPIGTLIATNIGSDGFIRGQRQGVELRDTGDGKKVREFQPQFGRAPAAISRDGKQMAFVEYTGVNWQATTVVAQFFQPVPKFLRFPVWAASEKSMRFSSDGSMLGAAALGGQVARVWDLKPKAGEERIAAINEANRYHSSPYDAVFSSDFKKVASPRFDYGSKTGFLRLTDVETDKAVWNIPVEGQQGCAMDFSPDGKQIAVGTSKIFICDAATGTKIRSFERDPIDTRGVSFGWTDPTVLFSPNGKLLCYAALGTSLTLWDVPTGRRLHVFSEASGGGESPLAFSPDGTKLATIDNRHNPLLLDTATGTPVPVVLRGTNRFLHEFWFSPDGKLLAAIDDSKIVYWDAKTGDERLTLIFCDKGEDWFAMTPDGLFDGSERAQQEMGFRIGNGMNVVSAQQVAGRYYRPGLFHAILAGERPKVEKGK